MPRLVKGGKWVYGWVIPGAGGNITIPPAARVDYRFRAGDELVFLPGSRRSGGFGLSSPQLITNAFGGRGTMGQELGKTTIDGEGQVEMPPKLEVVPGSKLLAVRGSRYALGFVSRGPIYEEALKHIDELEHFGKCVD